MTTLCLSFVYFLQYLFLGDLLDMMPHVMGFSSVLGLCVTHVPYQAYPFVCWWIFALLLRLGASD